MSCEIIIEELSCTKCDSVFEVIYSLCNPRQKAQCPNCKQTHELKYEDEF